MEPAFKEDWAIFLTYSDLQRLGLGKRTLEEWQANPSECMHKMVSKDFCVSRILTISQTDSSLMKISNYVLQAFDKFWSNIYKNTEEKQAAKWNVKRWKK